jgi:hypothetical protein
MRFTSAMNLETNDSDRTIQVQVQRLHRLKVYLRWILVIFLWLTVGVWSLFQLREEIALWLDYWTWVAVRYGLAYNRLPAIGLALCVGTTVSVLIWQSRNILLGIPTQEQKRMEKIVRQINAKGSKHPLWWWVVERKSFPGKPH